MQVLMSNNIRQWAQLQKFEADLFLTYNLLLEELSNSAGGFGDRLRWEYLSMQGMAVEFCTLALAGGCQMGGSKDWCEMQCVTLQWGQFIFPCILTLYLHWLHCCALLILTHSLTRLLHIVLIWLIYWLRYWVIWLWRSSFHLCTYIVIPCSIVLHSRPYKFIIYNIYFFILVITCW